MASQPIVIGLAQYRQWKRHCLNAQLGRAFLDKPLTATWPKRGHNIFTRGRVVDLLGSSGNTDERLNFVVVRRQILVSDWPIQSEEHTSELQSHLNLVCRLLL